MIDTIKKLSNGRSCFHFISTEKIKPKQEKEINELLKYHVKVTRVSKNGVYVYYLTKLKNK